MAVTESRWSEFRRRTPPAKQAKTLLIVCLSCCLYTYGLLFCQPQQAHEVVMRENQRVAQQLHDARVKRALRWHAAGEQSSLRPTNHTTTTPTNSTGTADDVELQPHSETWIDSFFSFLSTLFLLSILRRRALLTRTPPARALAFNQWVLRLNRHRVRQGERPLSSEALRLVLRERALTGNDYDALLDYEDQSGPAMQALLESVGMTREEVARCPMRVLEPGDDLLMVSCSCAVCLDDYAIGETVRTIPCFHTFHTKCIDPWLSTKATCPICKHPAVT